MSCYGCEEKAKKINEPLVTIQEKAQEFANKTGEWIAIYQDEEQTYKYIRADEAAGYPVRAYVSPQL